MMKNIILIANEGKAIPDDVVQKVLDLKPTSFGVAYSESNIKGGYTLEYGSTETPPSLDDFTEIQVEKMEKCVLFTFGFQPDMQKESIQPFVVVDNKDGEPILIMFAEGDFPSKVKDKSSHTPEFFLFMEYIRPKFRKIYDQVGGNFGKFMDEIRDSTLGEDIKNQIGDRGVISFMGVTGEIASFAKIEPDGHQFDWGFSSQTFDNSEKVAEAPPEPVKKSMLSGMLNKAKSAITPAATTTTKTEPAIKLPDPKPSSILPTDKPKVSATATILPAGLNTGAALTLPPQGYHGKQLKAWYRSQSVDGSLPDKWRDRPAIVVKPAKATKLAEVQEAVKPKDTSAHHIPEHKLKDTGAKNVADTQKNIVIAGKSLPIPVLSAESKKAVGVMIEKSLDVHSADIADPKKMQEMEKKTPTFVEQVQGIEHLSEIKDWPYAMLLELCTKVPEAGARLIFDLRGHYPDKKVTTDTTAEEEMVKTEATSTGKRSVLSGMLSRKAS